MSSIRPLVTITVLVVVGALLYVKINQGTPQSNPAATGTWEHPMEGVPPLAATTGAPTTSVDTSTAPWPATDALTPAPGASVDVVTASPPTTDVTPQAVPAVPPMPEVTTTTQAEAPAASVEPPLPANIPEARYPDQPSAETTTPAGPALGVTTSTETAGVAAAESSLPQAAETSTSASTTLSADQAQTPEQMNEVTAATTGMSNAPKPLDPNPLRPSSQTEPDAAYRAATTLPVTPIGPGNPVEKPFSEAWPEIQAALERGDLSDAHKTLSKYHDHPSLTPTDAERVGTLLSQLAGTVVYSTEHRLAPAHVVKQGETLQTIADSYGVPWQLLAKINGIATPEQLQPGQELKVVRGPFSAIVDLSRKEITLMVDERYAGKFPVNIAPELEINEGDWVVGKKSTEQAPAKALLLQSSAAVASGPAPTLVIVSDAANVNSDGGSVIKVAATDAAELSDILSIGSRVTTRK